jgi:citrate lyase synthetase
LKPRESQTFGAQNRQNNFFYTLVGFHQEITMPLAWSHSIADLDWNELSELYRAAPLGNKSPADLKTAFTNSMFKCFVYEDGKMIGAGRALADGIDCSYICDVAVLPSHQGTGLGKKIVAKLVSLSGGHRKIILYSVPGKEAFYKKLGFKRMTTAMAIFENQDQALERGYVNET